MARSGSDRINKSDRAKRRMPRSLVASLGATIAVLDRVWVGIRYDAARGSGTNDSSDTDADDGCRASNDVSRADGTSDNCSDDSHADYG